MSKKSVLLATVLCIGVLGCGQTFDLSGVEELIRGFEDAVQTVDAQPADESGNSADAERREPPFDGAVGQQGARIGTERGEPVPPPFEDIPMRPAEGVGMPDFLGMGDCGASDEARGGVPQIGDVWHFGIDIPHVREGHLGHRRPCWPGVFFDVEFPEVVEGSGTIVTESRELDAFAEVVMFGPCDLTVTIGETQTVDVTADDNVLPLLETSVEDGKLVIETTDWFEATERPNIVITVAELTTLELFGAADVGVSGLNNAAFSLEVAGSGQVTLDGTTTAGAFAIMGSGEVLATELVAEQIEVFVSGAGEAEVNAAETLLVEVFGSGEVRYAGRPVVTQTVLGSGRVEPIEESPAE